MFPGSVNQLRDIHVNLKPLLWGSALAHSCDACCSTQEASLEQGTLFAKSQALFPCCGEPKSQPQAPDLAQEPCCTRHLVLGWASL